jgi:hypothetical protein
MKKKTKRQLRAFFRRLTGQPGRARYGYHVAPADQLASIQRHGLRRHIPPEGDTKAVYTWHKLKLAKQHKKSQDLYWSSPIGIRQARHANPKSDPRAGHAILRVKLPRKTVLRVRSKAEIRYHRQTSRGWRGTGLNYQKLYYPEKEYVTTKRIKPKHIQVFVEPRRLKLGPLRVRRVDNGQQLVRRTS